MFHALFVVMVIEYKRLGDVWGNQTNSLVVIVGMTSIMASLVLVVEMHGD